MRSGSAPAWARELALAVCAEAGVAPPSVLRWRRSDREASTGLASPLRGSVAVTAGRDQADARHTLLHELAHWLTPAGPRRRRRGAAVHHGAAFYATALPLFVRHEEDPVAALRREASRYPSVLRHAVAAGVPGAAAILLERRAERARARARTRAGGHGDRWRVLVPEHAVRLVRDGRWYVCATCGRRLVGPTLVRAARRGRRERHVVLTREGVASPGAEAAG